MIREIKIRLRQESCTISKKEEGRRKKRKREREKKEKKNEKKKKKTNRPCRLNTDFSKLLVEIINETVCRSGCPVCNLVYT